MSRAFLLCAPPHRRRRIQVLACETFDATSSRHLLAIMRICYTRHVAMKPIVKSNLFPRRVVPRPAIGKVLVARHDLPKGYKMVRAFIGAGAARLPV